MCSHEDALGTAASIGVVVADLHLAHLVHAVGGTAACRVALLLPVVSADFSDNIIESLVDIDSGLGRRLDELAAKRPGQCFTLYMVHKMVSNCKDGWW